MNLQANPAKVTIREVTAKDYPVLARLMRFTEEVTITPEVMHDRDARFPPGGYKKRLAAELAGEVVGFAAIYRWPNEKAGKFFLKVAVEVENRRRGIGGRLYDAAIQDASRAGGTEFSIECRETEPEDRAFIERRGFMLKQHVFESSLEPARFDISHYRDCLDRVRNSGLRLFSFAETPQGDIDRRKHWALSVETSADIPGYEPERPLSYEEFCLLTLDAKKFQPEGHVIAADGDRWVGISYVAEMVPGEYYNMLTGVLKEYRGRGIAMATKVLATDYLRRVGAHLVRTNNDSGNKPMLAVNEKLGYVPSPGWFLFKKG